MGSEGQRLIALGHHAFEGLCVTALVGPATRETVWCLCNVVSKRLFAGLLGAFARAVDAGPNKRVVLFLDNAGFHIRPGLAVPDSLGLVCLPPHSPELKPAETLWPPVDKPVINELVPALDALVDTIGARCCDPNGQRNEISSRNDFAWWHKNRIPA